MNRSQLSHKINLRLLLSATLISLALSLFCYLFLFQTPALTKREFAFTALLWLALTPLVYFLLFRFLIPRLNQYSSPAQRNWLLLSLAVGLFFSLVTRPPQLILFFPKHTLQVEIPPGSPHRRITLEYATTALRGDISFSQFSTSGNWQRSDSGFTFSGPDPASLSWSGRTGDSASLFFSDTPALSDVQAGWDGNLTPLDTTKAAYGQIPFSSSFPTPWLSSTAARLIVGFTTGFLFLVITLFLAGVQLKPASPVKHKKGYWLLYALPMITIWGIFLLTFWPGLASQDPILQWQQVLTGQYSDAHPLLYTLLIGLVSRIYYSPAAVVIVQILMVSFSLSWGISELERMGVSQRVLWGLAILCALLPVNILSTITIRKDVPYSAALLALSIIILKLINTRGKWLQQPWNCLGLGVALGVVTLTRINGLPVALGLIVLILVFYHHQWRHLATAVGAFTLMMAIMYGPVYSILKVKHVPEFGEVLFLQHIAAHLQAGTLLTLEQEDFLGSLAPLNAWDYSCCEDRPIKLALFPEAAQQNFDMPLLKQEIQRPAKVALSLFLKDPLVDLRHMVCASQQVWSLNSTCSDWIIVSLSPLSENSNPVLSHRFPPNQMGFEADSRFPGLIRFANPYLQLFSKGFLHWVNYTTAIYFYLAIYCTALLAFRKRRGAFLLFLIPIMIQSATLLLINISQTYRYQYGVVLVGLLSIGFLFAAFGREQFESKISYTIASGEDE